jgi:hypothetical protein
MRRRQAGECAPGMRATPGMYAPQRRVRLRLARCGHNDGFLNDMDDAARAA